MGNPIKPQCRAIVLLCGHNRIRPYLWLLDCAKDPGLQTIDGVVHNAYNIMQVFTENEIVSRGLVQPEIIGKLEEAVEQVAYDKGYVCCQVEVRID